MPRLFLELLLLRQLRLLLDDEIPRLWLAAVLQYLRQTRWGYALQYWGVAGAPCRAGHFNAGRECPLRPRADRCRWASSRWGRGAGSDMLRRPHELGTVALGRQVAPTALTAIRANDILRAEPVLLR